MLKLSNGMKVKLTHLHCGNSSRNQRHGHPYLTIAEIITEDGNSIGRGKSMCSRQDVPNRARGRDIAIGRAIKNAKIDAHLVY